jgi:hypothetical protein
MPISYSARPADSPVWATSGDKVRPTDSEISIGWPDTDVPPARERFNWLQNWTFNQGRYYLQNGVPAWSSTENYQAGAYVQQAGHTYRSLQVTTNNNPVTDTSYWERWGYSTSELMALFTSMYPNVGNTTFSAFGFGCMKSTIMLFDVNPGTRSITLKGPGKYRIFVVGGGAGGMGGHTTGGGAPGCGGPGGGYSEKIITLTTNTTYSYTVGAAGVGGFGSGATSTGGTSSFGALISATGGSTNYGGSGSTTAGIGTGGDVNTSGGVNIIADQQYGGCSSGHRFGDGKRGGPFQGAGWQNHVYKAVHLLGGSNVIDGYGIGLPPGDPGQFIVQSATLLIGLPGGYGSGGGGGSGTGGVGGPGGLGSGGGYIAPGGPGAGGGGNVPGSNGADGGTGIVGIEVIS